MLRRLEFLVAQEVLVVVALHRRIAGSLEVSPGLTALLRSIAAYLGFRASAKIVKRTKRSASAWVHDCICVAVHAVVNPR